MLYSKPVVDDSDDPVTLVEAAGPKADPELSLYGDELAPGALAGEYVIQKTLAAGGCGTVYFAEHRILKRQAAVKVLHRELAGSADMLERFVREARAVNLIRHPNIVDIYEFGQLQDGRPYYVMELLEGVSLNALLRKQGRLSPQEALELIEPVCVAVQAAHEAGVVHRDLKASNIQVTGGPGPGPRLVKLLDFGIAKLLEPDPSASGATSVGRRLGTPHAMAPEQIRGEPVDARTDVYGLGVLLYHVLTGRYPFEAPDGMELERLHLEATPPPPSRFAPVSPAIDEVVLRCLEKSPAQRYRSVAECQQRLREAVGARPRTNPPATALPAIAIYVETRMDEGAHCETDDALLDDLEGVLDLVERTLRGAGYLLPLQTGSAVLGVHLLAGDAEAQRAARTEALAVAGRLWGELAQRPGAHAGLHVHVFVHAERAVVRTSAAGPEIVGGAITRIGAWAAQKSAPGLVATAQAVAGLPESARRGLVVQGDLQGPSE